MDHPLVSHQIVTRIFCDLLFYICSGFLFIFLSFLMHFNRILVNRFVESKPLNLFVTKNDIPCGKHMRLWSHTTLMWKIFEMPYCHLTEKSKVRFLWKSYLLGIQKADSLFASKIRAQRSCPGKCIFREICLCDQNYVVFYGC